MTCVAVCVSCVQCVDWSDAGEARQAVELMAGWATIDTADALELLSPAFKSEEVLGRAGAVFLPIRYCPHVPFWSPISSCWSLLDPVSGPYLLHDGAMLC